MKFYSEKTGLLYNTEAELNAAEIKVAKKEAEKKEQEEAKKALYKDEVVAEKIKDIITTIKKFSSIRAKYLEEMDKSWDETQGLIDKFFKDYKDYKPAQVALEKATTDLLKDYNSSSNFSSLFDFLF